MAKPKTPSQNLASWLDRQLAELPAGSALPTDRQLAIQWQMSERTVRSVLNRYRDRGAICRVPGKGTFVGGSSDTPAVEPSADREAAPDSHTSLVEQLRHSIASGEFAAQEPLPPVKYMSRRFNMARSTVTRAYQTLVEMGYVTKVGKLFWVGEFRRLVAGAAKKEVYLFDYSAADLSRLFGEDNLALAFRKLERELLKYGFILRYGRMDDFASLTRTWLGSTARPYGLIFTDIRQEGYETIRPALDTYLARVQANKPTVLIYGVDITLRRSGFYLLHRGNVYTTQNRTLARFLFEKQFRRVCFFYDETKWQLSFLPAELKLRTELKHLDRSVDFRLHVKQARKRSREGFFGAFYKEAPPERVDGFLSKYETTSHAVVEKETVLSSEFPPVEKSLRGKTAWVFAYAEHAARALDWAEKNRIRVPQDLAIVGIHTPLDVAIAPIEDDSHFHHLGISCCVCDWERIGYLMAHAVIGDIPIEKTSKGFIRVGALMLERQTTP
jgi:DNA-binding transcriptional regulator YhcF (GntR family)